jgi:hypothetical protein
MKFARWTFLIAGSWGLLILVPQYFLLEKNGIDAPPAINHPEYYFGFIGVAIAFQIVFLLIAADPLRYRPMILAGIVEKFSFGLATLVLLLNGMVSGPIIFGAAVDLLLGLCFIDSYVKVLRDPGA